MTTYLRHLLPAGVIALTTLTSACDIQVNEKGMSVEIAEGKATDETTRTYALPPGGRLEILNDVGTIEAFPASGPQVEVRILREVRAGSDEAAREGLAKLEIGEDASPGRVKLEVRGGAGWRGFNRSARVNYRVSLPSGLDVSLQTQNGNVRLENVDGKLAASSTNGGINGRGVSGSLQASTVNGGINIGLASVTGDSRLTTVNGGIRLDVPRDLNATLEATTVNGGISTSGTAPLQATEREPRHLSGSFNQGGPTITLQTTNGGIRIGTVDEAPAADVIKPQLKPR